MAEPIKNLVLTEVIKQVTIVDLATKNETPAKVGDVLPPGNILKTGAESRAELVAEDKTTTRVGSNTVFSIEANSRNVNLEKGSVLFHSPTGKGGGNIKSAGATASVLGTTLIVGANPNGGFKTMLLEGKGAVAAPNGSAVKLAAGQLSFSMPGQPPSRPLNFSLQSQVGSSKLINGFSKPVASIAKIDAAVAKQEKDRSEGKLNDTGLLIGDRPDTAFKVDSSLVQTVVYIQEVINQPDLPSLNKPDPRYLAAVQKNLSLGTPFAPGENIFGVQNGAGTGPDTSGAIPKNLPGNQEGEGLHSVVFARNFVVPADGPDLFIPTPIDIPSDINHAAIVASESIDFGKSVAFEGLSSPYTEITEVSDGNGTPSSLQSIEKWRPLTQLLLSAGNSVKIAEGAVLTSKVPLLEIFAAGSKFSEDLELAISGTPSSSSPVIDWNGVAIKNDEFVDDSLLTTGRIRISAPTISLTNTALWSGFSDPDPSVLDDANNPYIPSKKVSIAVAADNDLTIKTDTSKLLPLGFNSAEELSISGFSVKLTSKNKAVSITGVNIVSNAIFITAGTDITLDRVLTSSDTQPGNRKLYIEATNNLTVIDSDLQAVSPFIDSNQILTVDLVSKTKDVQIGDRDLFESGERVGEVKSKALTEVKTVLTAREVRITAAGNIDVRGLKVNVPQGSEGSFTAAAKGLADSNYASLSNVDLSQVQNVAVAAQTVVLQDTNFKEGSKVSLNSKLAQVAPDPGYGKGVTNGMVNFIKNVFYGTTEVKFASSTPMNNAQFQSAATSAGKDLSNITIGSYNPQPLTAPKPALRR